MTLRGAEGPKHEARDYLRRVDYPLINPSIFPTVHFKKENNDMISTCKWAEQCGRWLAMLNLEKLAVSLLDIEIDQN